MTDYKKTYDYPMDLSINRYGKLALALLGVFSLNLAVAQDPNTMDPMNGGIECMDDMERHMNEQGGGNPDKEQMMMERLDDNYGYTDRRADQMNGMLE